MRTTTPIASTVTPVTELPSPITDPVTTLSDTTAPTSVPPGCKWSAAVVNGDGASQHNATVLGFTNVSATDCPLPFVDQLVGRTAGDSGLGTIDGQPGGFFAIGPATAMVIAGDRAELVITTMVADLCQAAESIPVSSVIVNLSDGTTNEVPVNIDAACGIFYSQLGSWV